MPAGEILSLAGIVTYYKIWKSHYYTCLCFCNFYKARSVVQWNTWNNECCLFGGFGLRDRYVVGDVRHTGEMRMLRWLSPSTDVVGMNSAVKSNELLYSDQFSA